MGIRDRDYMKRRSDGDGKGSSSDSKAEELAQKLFNKFPKLLMWCSIGIVILIVVALIVLKFSGPAH